MISRPRKLLALAPIAAAWLLSDKTVSSFFVMLVGGLVIWVPYWLAWWLSDGFSDGFGDGYYWGNHCNSLNGYGSGPEGYGYYVNDLRVYFY